MTSFILGTRHQRVIVIACLLAVLQPLQSVRAEFPFPFIYPETRSIQPRHPSELPPSPVIYTPPPPTVSTPIEELEVATLTLDDAIRTALAQSEVVRVLAGVTARSSGRTIYDVPLAATAIDQQTARFDPSLRINNDFRQDETAGISVTGPLGVTGSKQDQYNFDLGLSKTTEAGGTLSFGTRANPTRTQFSEQWPSAVELQYTQPLLQGGGSAVNQVPIVLARIDTERSFFQYKDTVQELVRGVIDGYWRLVLARTNVWVRQQQVAQLEEALRRAEAGLRVGRENVGVVAQARVALANFRSTLIAAQADVLDREAALRSLLGAPPYDQSKMIPVTPPKEDLVEVDWNALVELAAEQRPDIIELKLILEADEQQLVRAENSVLPRVDATALYRWDGLHGEVPAGRFTSRPGQISDWNLGINFSVPLWLRAERARLRNRELLIARDEANLNQAVLEMTHSLAINIRNIASTYEQYLIFQETRAAARVNLDLQLANFQSGRVIFLVVLQAVADWGNAVNSEAQTLLQYNIELANLERQTGTILETHGVAFYEERYGSIGPHGRRHPLECYPATHRPELNYDRYPSGINPAEESFRLESPLR